MTPEQRLMATLAEHIDPTSLLYPVVLNAAVQYAREAITRVLQHQADHLQQMVQEIEDGIR